MADFLDTKEFLEFAHETFDTIPIPVDFLDRHGKIIYMNRAFADFLKIPLDSIVGVLVTDVNPSSKFMETLKTKKADIAMRHVFPSAGKEAVVHRIPILNKEGDLLGGFGMVLFEEVDHMKEILQKNEILHKELRMYKNEIAKLNKAKYTIEDIIGNSSAIVQCKKQLKKFANINFNVLILGESGVGKELFAQALHNLSDRQDQPFVSINCSAIPENLLEAELFGYEDGSFTGGKKGGNIGKFELANGGTIFLDEIGDMPHYMQAKLLRVLQEKEITKIGGKKPLPIDVRVISATHKDLGAAIKEQKFREDLYYRLNVLTIEIPALKKRKEDIIFLVNTFLNAFWKESGLYRKISQQAIDLLVEYDFPGNIRELKNIINMLCANSDESEIGINDIPKYILNNSLSERVKSTGLGLNEIIQSVEKEMITNSLIESGFNKSIAAQKLKIPRITLYRKIKEYGIDVNNPNVTV